MASAFGRVGDDAQAESTAPTRGTREVAQSEMEKLRPSQEGVTMTDQACERSGWEEAERFGLLHQHCERSAAQPT